MGWTRISSHRWIPTNMLDVLVDLHKLVCCAITKFRLLLGESWLKMEYCLLFYFSYATWSLHTEDCGSGHFRHSVCIYGVEDYSRLIKLRHLFVNKLMPSFDYGAAMCLLENVYNRTYFGNDNPLFEDYYATLPHVRYNNLKKQLKPGQKIDLYAFNCSHPYKDYYFWHVEHNIFNL